MTTVKVKLRPSTIKDRPGHIVYWVTHRQRVKQITTDYKVYPEEWDEKRSEALPVYQSRIPLVQSIAHKMARDVALLEEIISGLREHQATFTADEVVKLFKQTADRRSLFGFMKEIISQLKRLGKERTAETYATTLNSFMRFSKAKDIRMDEITTELMLEYEAFLKSHGVTMNTISFYNRILRAVYNRAVENGLTRQRHPFKHVYTGIDKTVKRAIPLGAIKRIKGLDLSKKPGLDLARDLFLFSFYTRGMAFIDMAYLQKSNLQNGVLTYRRRKTGQQLFIRWERCMQEIVDKYSHADTGYLMPIIKKPGNERKQYRCMQHLTNNRLKKISTLAGLQVNLTMYVTRHSWASIARTQNIPLAVISEGMGHDSENTTLIYLASLDNSSVDDANEQILKGL